MHICEFCNKAKSAHKIADKSGRPEITVLACTQCLQEIQLGHVLKDIYGWSWTKFEGEFIAEHLEPGLEA